MNLTVGPLPPAVYWRRRAIVLGALFLVILLIVYACGGSGRPDGGQHNAAAADNQTPTASASMYPILSGASLSPPPASLSPPASPAVSGSPAPTAVSTSPSGMPTCSDKDIKVSVSIESTSATDSALVYGGTFSLKLKVRNISHQACARDVGSAEESLSIYKGTTKIWSSDDCNLDSGASRHDVRTFQPNILIFAQLYWNSYLKTSISCAKGKTPAARGSYELTGRVGTAPGDPVTFTIT